MAAFTMLAMMFTASAIAALPELLPGGKAWTAKNTAGKTIMFETKKEEKIACEKAKGSGSDNAAGTLGPFELDFENCSVGGVIKCNSLGDAAGIILLGGEDHYVWYELSPLNVAVLYLPSEVHIECTGFALFDVRSNGLNGGLVCTYLEPESLKVAHVIHCEQEKGIQHVKRYFNSSGTEVTGVQLVCSKNQGAFEECAVLLLGEVQYTEAVKFMSV